MLEKSILDVKNYVAEHFQLVFLTWQLVGRLRKYVAVQLWLRSCLILCVKHSQAL